MTPLVSICVPNLNTRAYLQERFDTIFNQTYTNWEVIVSDNFSEDGAWEFFQELARKDKRISIAQAPRAGMYANWNNCIRRARGEYVYIATSDDTMSPDCLERMVLALEHNTDCGLCHCGLKIIDENGAAVGQEFAWDNFVQQRYFGDWMRRPHVRRAPHDGLLHFGYFTVYTSLTQLLVRRRVFEEYGLFRTDCKSYADFEWGMRVGLNENAVHVPHQLATWRRHREQATQNRQLLEARAKGEFHRLVLEALKSLASRNPQLMNALMKSRLNDYYLVDELKARMLLSPSNLTKVWKMIDFVFRHPKFAFKWLFTKVFLGRKITDDFGVVVRNEMARLNFGDMLSDLSATPWPRELFMLS